PVRAWHKKAYGYQTLGSSAPYSAYQASAVPFGYAAAPAYTFSSPVYSAPAYTFSAPASYYAAPAFPSYSYPSVPASPYAAPGGGCYGSSAAYSPAMYSPMAAPGGGCYGSTAGYSYSSGMNAPMVGALDWVNLILEIWRRRPDSRPETSDLSDRVKRLED